MGLTGTIDPRKPVREWLHDYNKSVPELRELVEEYRVGKQ